MKRWNLHRILVIKLADIGDLLTATPALRALRESYPDARLDLLTTPQAAAVVPSALVDEVLAIQRHLVGNPGQVAGLLRLLLRLRHGRYDAALIFHHLTLAVGAAKYRLLAAASGARLRAGLDNGRGSWLTHAVVDEGFGARHEVVYWLQVASLLGAVTRDRRLAAHYTAADQEWARQVLAGQRAGLRVAIHPGSGGYSLARRWEAEKWAAVADRLSERYGAHIILVGTAADGVAAVKAAMKAPALDLSGRTTLPRLAALLARCHLFLGADSGVMHLAAAVGVPVVALFGPSNHRAWRPWRPDGQVAVVRLGLSCSPCSYVGHSVGWREGCWHRFCMADLTPDQVMAAVERLGIGEGRSDSRARNFILESDYPEAASATPVSLQAGVTEGS